MSQGGSPRAAPKRAPLGAAQAGTSEAPGRVCEDRARRDGSRDLDHGEEGGLEGGGTSDSARESAASSCAAGSRARCADFEGAPSAGRPSRGTPESGIGEEAPHAGMSTLRGGGVGARRALEGESETAGCASAEQQPAREASGQQLGASDQAPPHSQSPSRKGGDQGDRRTLVGTDKAPSKRPLEGIQSLGGDAGVRGCGRNRVSRTGARTHYARTEPGHVRGITTVCRPDSTCTSHLASPPPTFWSPPTDGRRWDGKGGWAESRAGPEPGARREHRAGSRRRA